MLVADLIELFGEGVDAPLDDDTFEELARRVFRHQYEENPIYAGFCRQRGVLPDPSLSWHEIPAVPTRAFKRLPLVSGSREEVEVIFRTSGTTQGASDRGEHPVLDPRIYRASLLPNFREHLLPDDARLPLVSLVPSPRRAPHSSLSHMIGVIDDELAVPGGGWFVDPDGGIRVSALAETLTRLEAEEQPVLLVGTAFALVHWMDAMDRLELRLQLAPGSRIMETGGFKGRSRELRRSEFYGSLEERTGIPPARIVNEYGMTELLSQFYEPVLRTGTTGTARLAERVHVAPPWVRTRVLDPGSLDPVSPGEPGLLCHLDLANVGSVAAVLTEDMGVATGEGFRVLGRAVDAEPRGCSLAMDELLTAVGDDR